MIVLKTGNIFTNQCDMIVNTVNCQGVMGAGIAKEFKIRYPDMFLAYQSSCKAGQIMIGSFQVYHAEPWHILNFPTKNNWRYPSKIEYLERGLQRFVDTYKTLNIASIAFPLLGASRGGIPQELSLEVMERYLSQCESLEIEIWQYDPSCPDDLYPRVKMLFDEHDNESIKALSKMSLSVIKKIRAELEYPHVNSIQSLSRARGIGEGSLTHLVQLVKSLQNAGTQLSLF